LRPTLQLAQEVVARLGPGEILLATLPPCVAQDRSEREMGTAMNTLRVIFGDQLSLDLSALRIWILGVTRYS